MTNQDFDSIIKQQLNYCQNLLQIKNDEYKNNNDFDRFHSFKVAAELQHCSTKQALAGMMAKHSVSIYDMCQGGDYSLGQWNEKITDHINYLLLLKGIIVEEIKKEKEGDIV